MTEDLPWLQQVIDGIREAVVAVDAGGRIVTLNPEARRILKLEQEASSDVWATAVAPRLRSASGAELAEQEQPIARALAGELTQQEDYLLLEPNGAASIQLEIRAAPLRSAAGALNGAVLSFFDVTEKKAIEAVLARDADRLCVLAAELDDARRAAERSNQYKSRFLAGMSHELRTPLNAVIGFSELLEQEIFGPLNQKQRDYVSGVLASGRHLLAIVNDILDLSKVEAGRIEIVREFTPIQTIVDSALSVMESIRVQHGVTVKHDLPRDLPQPYVDPVRIKQVLYNLLSNAVKFSPRGAVVDVRGRAAGGVLEISIEDRGRGIRHEDLPKLFREFEQLAPAPGSKHVGTGLGLALSKRLIELHGGSIGVDSEFGRGSRFWVRLPVLERVSPEVQSALQGEGYVLTVQDDGVFAEILAQLLRSLGLASRAASSASEALEKVTELRPVAITVDVTAERLDGRGLIELLQNDARSFRIPVIAIADSSDAQRGQYLGDVHMLQKPFTWTELGDVLARAGVPSLALPPAATASL